MIYQVIDKKTKDVLGTYKSRKIAVRKADKLDNAYGGYRYGVVSKMDFSECFKCGD